MSVGSFLQQNPWIFAIVLIAFPAIVWIGALRARRRRRRR
jgi:hypothetical protein